MAQQGYDAFGGWYDKHTGEYLSDSAVKTMMREGTKAKVPTYRYAQKEAMKRGDANTYFMRKTARNFKRGGKRR